MTTLMEMVRVRSEAQLIANRIWGAHREFPVRLQVFLLDATRDRGNKLLRNGEFGLMAVTKGVKRRGLDRSAPMAILTSAQWDADKEEIVEELLSMPL